MPEENLSCVTTSEFLNLSVPGFPSPQIKVTVHVPTSWLTGLTEPQGPRGRLAPAPSEHALTGRCSVATAVTAGRTEGRHRRAGVGTVQGGRGAVLAWDARLPQGLAARGGGLAQQGPGAPGLTWVRVPPPSQSPFLMGRSPPDCRG